MDQTGENGKERNIPTKKTCIWAKISFFAALLGWIFFVLLLFFEEIGVCCSYKVLILCSLLLSFVLVTISFVSAIIGSIRIIFKRKILKGWLYIWGFFLFFILFWGTLMPQCGSVRRAACRVVCGTNLSGLGRAILVYDYDFGGYPTPDVWCDLLIQNGEVSERCFVCPDALKRGDKGPCHYALNPQCRPSSPDDVVLLFETKGGWNQYGGPELLTVENHKGEGCNACFNDGHVDFIVPEKLGELKWDNE